MSFWINNILGISFMLKFTYLNNAKILINQSVQLVKATPPR